MTINKLLVNRIARVLGDKLPAAALLVMPGTEQIFLIAEAIAQEVTQHKHLEDKPYVFATHADEALEMLRNAPTQSNNCLHYNMTLNGTCNDCGHKLTDEEWEEYPEGTPTNPLRDAEKMYQDIRNLDLNVALGVIKPKNLDTMYPIPPNTYCKCGHSLTGIVTNGPFKCQACHALHPQIVIQSKTSGNLPE